VHEHASGLTSTPKDKLFCSCKLRKFIGQNKAKILKLQSQNFNFLGQKIGCPSYFVCNLVLEYFAILQVFFAEKICYFQN